MFNTAEACRGMQNPVSAVLAAGSQQPRRRIRARHEGRLARTGAAAPAREQCVVFARGELCPYGNQCGFLHGNLEARVSPPVAAGPSPN